MTRNIGCNPGQNNTGKMDQFWKTLMVMVIIPSNLVEANVQNHRRHCSNQFCIEKNYEKLELPPPNNGSTVHVVITPHILEIFEVILYHYMYIDCRWKFHALFIGPIPPHMTSYIAEKYQ